MKVFNNKYAIRKLAIGTVSLVIGLSSANSSYIQAKEIESIAKLIHNYGKVTVGGNDSLKISLTFKEKVPVVEVHAYKNLQNVVIEMIVKEGKTYKVKINSVEKGKTIQSELEETNRSNFNKEKSSLALTKKDKDRESLNFAGDFNGFKFDIKASYEVSSKGESLVDKKDVSHKYVNESKSSKIPHKNTKEVDSSLISNEKENLDLSNKKYSRIGQESVAKPVTKAPAPRPETAAPARKAPVTKAETKAPVAKAPAPRAETKAPARKAPVTKAETKAPARKAPVTKAETKAPARKAPATKAETAAPARKAPAPRVVTAVPVTKAPVTKVVTEAPVTEVVSEAPVTRVVTEAPVTRIVTEAPVTRVVTEAPVTRVITEAPVTRVVTEAPITRIVTEAPATRIVTQQPAPIIVSNKETTQVITPEPIVQVIAEAPATRVVVEAPVTRVITEAPVTRIVTEAPATKIVTEAPVTKVVTEAPVTKIITETPTTRVIKKGPALVREEKPSIPIVVSKGEAAPVLEEKPSIAVETSKGEKPPVVEEKPSMPVETSKEEKPQVLEEKPSIAAETSKGEKPPVVEEKPSIAVETSKGEKPPVVEEKPSIEVETSKVETPVLDSKQEVVSRKDVSKVPFVESMLISDENRKNVEFNGNDKVIEKALNKLIQQGMKKEKPILSYMNIAIDDLRKELSISYNLADQDKAYIRSRVAIYDGDKLITEVAIDDLDSVLEELEHYDTPYRVVTTMTYDINDGNGPQEEVLEDKTVELSLKKIEIKDVDSVGLYKHENGNTNSISTLSSIPTDTEKYFVRVSSDRFRDKLLPVSNIEELEKDGVNYYRVISNIDELVEKADFTNASKYREGFTFLIPKTEQTSDADTYINFEDLAEAVKKNPKGTFRLGAELDASGVELAKGQKSYLGDFSGNLIGSSKDNVAYAIYGLKAPLFSRLSGKVSDLDLEDIKINTNEVVAGSLAIEALNATITNVAASGSIRSQRTIGGLVGQSTGSKIDNVSFKGDIYATNNSGGGSGFVGGIIGLMPSGSLSRAYVDAQINTFASNNSQRAGGVVGQANDGTITKVYAKGDLVNRSTRNNTTSGLTASVWPNATLTESTSEMNVPGGILLMADTAHDVAKVDNNTVAAVEGTVSSLENSWSTKVSKEEAAKRLETYGITATTEDSKDTRVDNSLSIDYTSLHKASPDRETAYLNIEKLMPFYNKEQIVKYGNLVDVGDKLYSTKLLSVTPMLNDTILSNIAKDKTSLNKLMLHYADGTIAYLDIKYKEDFKNTSISEYDIAGTKLIYTPEQFISDYSDIVAATSADLKAVKLKSEQVLNSLGLVVDKAEIAKLVTGGLTEALAKERFISDKIDQLYIGDAFEKVKSEIDKHLADILATDKSINTTKSIINDRIVDYIKDNKESLLLGLTYMQRWYDIDFGNFNFQKLATFHQDFFGRPVNTLEWLVGLAKNGYENIRPANNVSTYINNISPNTGITNQMDYLSKLRQLFLPNKTDAQWFKDTTKAYLVEQKSEENPNIDVSFWQRVKDSVGIPMDELNGVLPLLTADEGIYIITNMSSITYGMYERYIDMTLKEKNPTEYAKQVKALEEKIDFTAKRFAENVDAWYRIVDDSVKQNMIKVVPIWDGYKRYDSKSRDVKWLPMYGTDPKTGLSENEAINDFFGPVGERGVVNEGSSGAIANGWQIKYVHYAALTDIGLGTYAHEMTHNLDGQAYLGNYGRRDKMRAESYATGMFEAPMYNSDVLAYNFIYDNIDKVFAKDRYQVADPDRFKNASDLQEYTKGTLDVLYTLDFAEATAVLAKPESEHKKWFIKLENSTNAKGEIIGRYRTITNDEWNALQLKNINDLIDNDIMTKRNYSSNLNPVNKELTRNGYDTVHMFSPIYSALANDNDAPTNSLIFKLRAYELMAAKGYKDGFLPYASNQLNAEAKAAGLATQTEKFVLDKIFNGKYKSWAEFKKEMYQDRINKVSELKPVVINYNGSEITISNFNQIQELMNVAVNQDISSGTMNDSKKSKVHVLKAAVYNAYLRETKDFRESIYVK